MRRILSGMACLAFLTAAGCKQQQQQSSTEMKATPVKQVIAVIPKGTTHVYWKSVEAGARAAGKDLNVDIVWKGPLKENDRAQQIAILQQFVSEKVSGIVLAPLDEAALQSPVQSAAARKIPVVIFDSALRGTAGKDFASFVATNNRKGGQLGGEQLAKDLGGKGKVVLLRYQEGSASTAEREAGFLDAIKKYPGIKLLVDNRYGGATAGEAKTAAMDLLDKLKAADGVFCPNESTSFGMLLALRQANLAGKIKFVGFDTSDQLLDGLKKGEINALVAQNPKKMGYEAVKTVVNTLHGTKPQSYVDTGVALITRDNLNTPDIQKLLGTE